MPSQQQEMHDFQTFVLGVQRILRAYPRMTRTEMAALAAWGRANPSGDGQPGLIVWPGWPAVHRRLEH